MTTGTGRAHGRRKVLRRSLLALPVAFALLLMPTVGGSHTGPARSVAEAHDRLPAAVDMPVERSEGALAAPAAGRPGDPHSGQLAGTEEHLRAPVPAPQPGSAAYVHLQRAWDAADLAEARPAGTEWRSVHVDGVVRRYLLSVPTVHHPAPLLLVFHGLTQRAGPFAAAHGLVPATRAAGEVLCLPESSGPAFNDGRLGRQGPDDDAFALAVVDQLTAQHLVDPRRVVVAGFSNGAGMAMEVAARHPGSVAAVVSIDGALIDAPTAPRPTGPVRAVLVHGTADHIQPWNGRHAAGPTWPAYVSQPATVGLWVAADHAGAPATRELRGGPRQARVTEQTWSVGPSGPTVTFYAVDGMGHRWPTAAPDTIDATQIVVSAAATASLSVAPGTTAG